MKTGPSDVSHFKNEIKKNKKKFSKNKVNTAVIRLKNCM